MTANLRYDRSILKQAIGNFIKRVYLKRFVWLSIVAVLIVIISLYSDSPWIEAFGCVPALTIPTMIALAFWFRFQESLKRLSRLDNGHASMTLSDSCITLESAVGKSEMKWFLFTELWEFPTNYLLLYSSNQFLTLPKDQVTPEFIGFIRDKLLANLTKTKLP
jgi:hypothetical protein